MTAGHEFYKKLTCAKAKHVVRSVDGGEAHSHSITRASNTRSSSTSWTASSKGSWDAFTVPVFQRLDHTSFS